MAALLAFDTATERLHLALGVGARSWVREAAAGPEASSTLLPALFAMLDDAGIALRDLDAIGFGRGPGAFTGLRTACSVAQGLALGADRPVLALDTLMAVADDARRRCGVERVWVVHDARMGEVYAAQYRHDAGRWLVLDAPALYGIDTLCAHWDREPAAAVAGNALAAFGERLEAPGAQRIADAAPRGEALLALARSAWDAGAALDAAEALPLYLRDKVALTTQERAAAKAAKERA